MATTIAEGIKISDMPTIVAPLNGDYIPVVRQNATPENQKISLGQIVNFVKDENNYLINGKNNTIAVTSNGRASLSSNSIFGIEAATTLNLIGRTSAYIFSNVQTQIASGETSSTTSTITVDADGVKVSTPTNASFTWGGNRVLTTNDLGNYVINGTNSNIVNINTVQGINIDATTSVLNLTGRQVGIAAQNGTLALTATSGNVGITSTGGAINLNTNVTYGRAYYNGSEIATKSDLSETSGIPILEFIDVADLATNLNDYQLFIGSLNNPSNSASIAKLKLTSAGNNQRLGNIIHTHSSLGYIGQLLISPLMKATQADIDDGYEVNGLSTRGTSARGAVLLSRYTTNAGATWSSWQEVYNPYNTSVNYIVNGVNDSAVTISSPYGVNITGQVSPITISGSTISSSATNGSNNISATGNVTLNSVGGNVNITTNTNFGKAYYNGNEIATKNDIPGGGGNYIVNGSNSTDVDINVINNDISLNSINGYIDITSTGSVRLQHLAGVGKAYYKGTSASNEIATLGDITSGGIGNAVINGYNDTDVDINTTGNDISLHTINGDIQIGTTGGNVIFQSLIPAGKVYYGSISANNEVATIGDITGEVDLSNYVTKDYLNTNTWLNGIVQDNKSYSAIATNVEITGDGYTRLTGTNGGVQIYGALGGIVLDARQDSDIELNTANGQVLINGLEPIVNGDMSATDIAIESERFHVSTQRTIDLYSDADDIRIQSSPEKESVIALNPLGQAVTVNTRAVTTAGIRINDLPVETTTTEIQLNPTLQLVSGRNNLLNINVTTGNNIALTDNGVELNDDFRILLETATDNLIVDLSSLSSWDFSIDSEGNVPTSITLMANEPVIIEVMSIGTHRFAKIIKYKKQT